MKTGPIDNNTYYRLSHAQKRIFYDDKLNPGASVSTQAFIVKYRETLDKDLLEKAINKVIQKNQSFLIRIVELDFDPEPRQYIAPFQEYKLEAFDFSGPESEQRLKVWINRATRKPIKVLNSELFYFAYLKFNENESGYYMKFHHAASDGGSYPLIFSEINAYYKAFRDGVAIDDTPNPGYLPYIDEEQNYLGSELFKKDKSFWHSYLLPVPDPVELSTKAGSPSHIKGDACVAVFPDQLRKKIQQYCISRKTSLFKVFFTALSAYLSRVTSHEEIPIAAANHNRMEEHRKNVVGMYVSTIPFKVFVDQESTFDSLVSRNGDEINKILKYHQKYPFDLLASELREITNTNVGHLLDFFISGHGDVPKEDYTFEHIFQGYTPNALTIHINYNNKYGDGILELEYEYQTEKFTAEEIRRLHTGIGILLNDALDHSDKKIAELLLLSDEEKQQILNQFNNYQFDYPRNTTIQSMFQERVIQTPQHVAVSFDQESITYEKLNEKANRLARLLRQKGIGPDQIVGVMVERSIEMIVGIYAVIKAGGAYLPIDPHYPEERIRYLLLDSSARVLLTRSKHMNIVQSLEFGGQILDLDDAANYNADPANLEPINSPSDLAYIIYTSGSTGNPKGVMIEHVSAVNLLLAMDRVYPLEPSDVYLLKTAFLFDVSVSEIFGWFWRGGRLAILEPGGEKDPIKILDVIAEENVTHINFVPSMFNLFVNVLENDNIDKLKSLKYIFLAGEAIWTDSILKFRGFNLPIKIENLYGPTEATVYASLYPVEKWKGVGGVSIGVPVDNLKLLIISTDEKSFPKLQPIGVPGELTISGVQLARGYLNRPELTAEKFIDNPFHQREGWENTFKKIYRTGDLTRWDPDGNVDYLGRIDHQVKIRGFRIETGEIETQLSKIPQVKEAIVMARDDRGSEKYLCAYIVVTPGETYNEAELINHLSENLPEYMTPSYFVQLPKIPLTPTGKVNRKSLPAPDMSRKGADYVAARDDIEETLVTIWSDILNLKKEVIGIDDSFFKLGGHSLKAALMITIIHKELKVKIPMHQIFEAPSIRKLGELIKNAAQAHYSALKKAPVLEYYPLTSAQRRLFFMDVMDSNSTLYNIPVMDIYHRGTTREKLEESFRRLIRRHESLRTAFLSIDGEPVQKVLDQVGFHLECYEMREDGMIYSDEAGKEWTKITGLPLNDVVEHFVRPFDLKTPPLIRGGMINIGGAIQILMLDVHHIVTDGVSMVHILHELWQLYDDKQLSTPQFTYKDYAYWINSKEQQDEIQKQEAFWLNEFSGELPVLSLPSDYPRPAKMTFDGDSTRFEIDRNESRKFKNMVAEQEQTLFMALFASFNILLSKLSGQEDIVVGTAIAGRKLAEIQDIVGMFVGTLALRNFPASDKPFNAFMAELKEKAIHAFENQEYPFEKLVSKVAGREDPSRNPLFDVFFELENEDDRTEYLLEVLMLDKSNPYNYKVKKAKFDITIFALEADDLLQFSFEYNTSLFKEETIERFVRYFKKIISSVAENPFQKIGDIELITEGEKNQIVYLFNDSAVIYPHQKTIHELFMEQADRTPNETAVIFQDKTFTYRQLDEKTDQLAAVLRKMGVQPDHLLGIMVRRSAEMMFALLGVLKAGGAYVPIDPEYPADRIEYMLKDSNARILLMHEDVRDKMSEIGPLTIQYVDVANPELYQTPAKRLENITSPHHLAYVIYTSGSTGKPKGVMLRQRNAVNFIKGMETGFDLTPPKTILALTTICFDIFFLETLLPVTLGLTVAVAGESQQRDPEELKQIIVERGVNLLQLTPSRLKLLLSSGDDYSYLNHIKEILIGGEQFPQLLFNQLKSVYNGNIIDVYGPTETTVWSTLKNLSGEQDVTIGKPIANTQIYICDKNMKLQPTGVAGELWIGGDGVARGYANKPEMTAERFIPNPFDIIDDPDRPYKEIYRTGDLARWLPNGDIECLGRIDHQVKIRGFRIETEEIENQILKLPEVDEAVVVVRKDASGENYLCAYLVSTQKLDMMTIREPLTKTLPDYMIPSYFMQLDKIPLTPNGKVDRKALPEPEGDVMSREYVAPTTDMEINMAEEWAAVLGLEKVGVDDNFFHIGGDSLKTILISSRLQKRAISVSVNDFFANPSIRQLAKLAKKTAPVESITAARRPENLIDADIQKEYEWYLDQIENEAWPDLSLNKKPREILLTGAAGYLGVYILAECIRMTDALISIPIRAKSPEDARQRLKEKLNFYFGPDFYPNHQHRLRILPADLAKKNLGLDATAYDALADTADTVIHSAALVKHYGLYDDLYRNNVEAVIHLLEFALLGRKKDFHFISTMDTGRGDINGKDYLLFTEFAQDEGQVSEHLYIKSKFEAEKKVMEYRQKGLNTSIYRAGNVTFNSLNGTFQENIADNFFYALLRALVSVGFLSAKMKKMIFDMSFVNDSAKAIVAIMLKEQLNNNIFHISNPNTLPVTEMVELLQKAGVPVPLADDNEIERHLAQYEGNPEYEKIIERVKLDSWAWESVPNTKVSMRNDRTVRILKRIGVVWPKTDLPLIKKMMDHCKQVGFIK